MAAIVRFDSNPTDLMETDLNDSCEHTLWEFTCILWALRCDIDVLMMMNRFGD